MTHTVPWDASQVLPWRAGLAYGLLGLPLAFAALPLYVVLPHYYASNLGLPLASVGALLLLVRLMDAGAEPLLGRLSDRLYRRTAHTVLWVAGAAAGERRRHCPGCPGYRSTFPRPYWRRPDAASSRPPPERG